VRDDSFKKTIIRCDYFPCDSCARKTKVTRGLVTRSACITYPPKIRVRVYMIDEMTREYCIVYYVYTWKHEVANGIVGMRSTKKKKCFSVLRLVYVLCVKTRPSVYFISRPFDFNVSGKIIFIVSIVPRRRCKYARCPSSTILRRRGWCSKERTPPRFVVGFFVRLIENCS